MGFQSFGIVAKNRIGIFTGIAALVTALAFFVAGCSVSTNDSPTPRGPLKMTLPQEACLNSSIPVIENYFQGSAAPQDVNAAWDCISGALTLFTTSTTGANPNFYSSRELRSFLQTFYLGDIKMSDQLLMEIMRIKQLLLGGADDRLTREELAAAQLSIQTLRVESLRVLPYVKYISQSITPEEAQKNVGDVEAAIAAFQKSMTTLGSLFGRGDAGYGTDDLASLLEELKPIFVNWKGPEKAISYLSTFSVIKATFLNPPGNVISPYEWQPLMTNAGHVYAIYMRMHYLMSGRDIMTGPGLDQLTTAYSELISIVSTGIAVKPTRVIAFAQLDQVIDELFRLNLIDDRFRDTTFKGLIRTLCETMMNPARSGARPKVIGLDQNVLNRMNTIGAGFLDMQHAWDHLQSKARTSGLTNSDGSVPLKNVQKLWPNEVTKYADAKEDLRRLFVLPSPLTFRENGTVVFDNRASQLSISQTGFMRYNWESVAARVLVSGYATDATAGRWQGLTQAQIKTFFTDAHDLGVDLQILEPKDDDLWQTSFNESNMFTLSALNDSYMSYTEIFDYLAYLLGGGVMSSRLYAYTSDHCAHVGVDAFNRPTMDINCFRTAFGTQFVNTEIELPEWIKVRKATSDWASMEQALEAAARTTGFSDEPIATSDMTRLIMVQQYIESLFVRYDANHDGAIDYTEAMNAEPLFDALLKQASGFTSAKKIEALYMYILSKGKPPTSLGDKLYFQLIWLNSSGKWKDVRADRLKLVSVIAALKSSAAAAATTAAEMQTPLEGVQLPVSPVTSGIRPNF